MLKRNKLKILLAAALTIGVGAAAAAWAQNEVIAVRGGTIYTITRGIVEGGTVLIRNGKIEVVGKGVSIPKGAEIIDAARAAVFPGFIDAFTDLGADEVMFGGDFDEATSPVTPQLRIIDGINPENEFIPTARKMGTTAVLAAPGIGNLISGQSALLRLAGATVKDMVLKFPVAVHINLGEAPKRRYGSKNQMPQTRMGEAALLRQTFTEVREYAASLEQYEKKLADFQGKGGTGDKPEKPAVNLKYEALIPVLKGTLPVVITAERLDDILTALRIADEFGLRVILAGGADAWKVKERLAEKKIPVLIRPEAAARMTVETQGAVFENAALLQKAGIRIAFMSGSTRNLAGLVQQARLAMAYGLTQEEALKALTINPAEIFGAADELGSLEKGKEGNVVVFDGNPLLGPAKVKAVVVGGRVIKD